MIMIKDKKKFPIIKEVKIEPAANGFMIEIEDDDYNHSKFVCKNFKELLNSLKTLNWGSLSKESTLNEVIAKG